MAKAKKAKSKKSAARKTAGKTKKSAKRSAASSRRAPAKKSKKAAARKTAKPAARKAGKAAPKKKQKLVGEGDYAASRAFLKDQSNFVKKNKARIPEMGKEAERALEGPEGESLRAAEQEAMNRSTIE
jgi:hypothetical protein